MGSVNRDLLFFVPRITRPGETIHSTTSACGIGGKGANQAVAAARSGAATWFAGRCGSDGGEIAEVLTKQGVDCTHLHIGSGRTGEAVIQITPEGENAIVLIPGENFCFDKEHIISVLDCFGPGDTIMLQNEITRVPYIMEQAHRRGLRILFNPAPCTPETAQYPLEIAHTIVLNEGEARMLIPDGPSDPSALIGGIASRCPEGTVVITLGERGSLWMHAGKVHSVDAVRVDAVDTTCAGDTFIGFYAGSLARGYPAAEALSVASRAAAVCATRIGGIAAIPTWEEVKRHAC